MTITDVPFIAEDVAVAADGRLLVSGVLGRTVLVRDRDRFRAWLQPGRMAPLGGLFGMAADPRHRRLWIAETFGTGVPGGSGSRRTGILEVDLSSGRVLGRHAAPQDSRERWIGDVAIGKDGTVYASDSKGAGLFILPPGGGDLRLAAQLPLTSPQGLVESRDGTAILLADYASGLHRVDLATGADTPLTGDAARLRGIDGLERDGDWLIATYNGGAPNRVLRIHLAPGEHRADQVETIAEDPQRIDDLSLGTIVGGRVVLVAHSQWADVHATGRMTSALPARLAVVPRAVGSRERLATR